MTLLNRWLTGSTAYANYQRFIRKIVEPLFNELGTEIEETDHKLVRYARQIAINLACEAGLESCLSATAQKLQNIVAGTQSIHPDLQSAIYCNGLRQSESATFTFLLQKMFASNDQAERTLIINALGCSSKSDELDAYLALVLQEDDKLRLQEKFRILAAPLNNGELGLQVMISFIKTNYLRIIGISESQVKVMLSNIAPRIASTALQTEFNELLNQIATMEPSGLTSEEVEAYRTTVNNNLIWQEKYLDEIHVWLLDDGSTTTPIEEDTTTTTGEPTESTSTTTEEPTESTTTTTTQGAGSSVVSTMALVACVAIKYLM